MTSGRSVFISVDMEGVAGVASPLQTRRGNPGYEDARALMAAEADAAVAGAFDGGAGRVVVNDSHGDMMNLRPADLDARAELIVGSPKTGGMMVDGLDASFDVALFIGYHARAGTDHAVLAHTFSSRSFADVALDGIPRSEAEFNAAVAGAHGVPVGLVTGDEAACEQARGGIPGVHTLAVKRARGTRVTAGVHPEVARDLIRARSAEVVAAAHTLAPLATSSPVTLSVDFTTLVAADVCATLPGSKRIGTTVSFEAADIVDAHAVLMLWMYAAAGANP